MYMSELEPKQVLAAARESLSRPLSFDAFLAKLPTRDRFNAQRRVEVMEVKNPTRVQLWRQLACGLMTLAPHAAKLVGSQGAQFYIADGKYRMQVFALEDLQDGNFTVYCPDVLDEAIAAGLLAPTEHNEPHVRLVVASGEPLSVELLDGRSHNNADHFKDLTGWNRKALRITVPPSASPRQIEATELLCAIAAQHFIAAKPASTNAASK
jgi:hypothetical protein